MFRLFSLALAKAALANVVLLPIGLLFAHAINISNIFVILTCIDLLAAAILLMNFCRNGLHRKDQSGMPPIPDGVALACMFYFGFCAFGCIPMAGTMLLVLIAFPMVFLPFIFVPLAIFLLFVPAGRASSAIDSEFAYFMQAAPAPNSAAVPFHRMACLSLALVAMSGLILCVSPVPQSISKSIQSTRESVTTNNRFQTACLNTSVEFYKKPGAPVHSIAFEGKADGSSMHLMRYILVSADKISYRDKNDPRFSESLRQLNLDFMESRRNPRTGRLSEDDNHLYMRFPARGQDYGIDAFTADVLVVRHDPDDQEDMRTVLTITDRRNSELLAKMSYIADMKNRVGCGANRPDEISEEAFVADALAP